MYQIWRHDVSGERYLVKTDGTDGDVVTEAFGPLNCAVDIDTGESELSQAIDSPEDFELNAEDGAWINENQDVFSHESDCGTEAE